VEFSNPTSGDGRDDGYISLRINDDDSGEVLTEVEIPSGRWWRLAQGGTQRWPAYVSTRLDRVRKTMMVETARLNLANNVPEDEAMKAAMARPEAELAEEIRVAKHNYGWGAVYRHWEPTDS
jgi:hypothetical protein